MFQMSIYLFFLFLSLENSVKLLTNICLHLIQFRFYPSLLDYFLLKMVPKFRLSNIELPRLLCFPPVFYQIHKKLCIGVYFEYFGGKLENNEFYLLPSSSQSPATITANRIKLCCGVGKIKNGNFSQGILWVWTRD